MRAIRRTGLAFAAAATVLWALVLLAVLTADPADGANIGAGLAGLLAMVLSTAASITLLVAVAAPASRRRGIPWAAAGLAVLSVLVWPVMWVGAYAVPDQLWAAVLVGGVAAMIVSSLLLFRAAGGGRRGTAADCAARAPAAGRVSRRGARPAAWTSPAPAGRVVGARRGW